MSGKHNPPAENHREESPREDAARQCLVSHFESRVGSETTPAQFREPRRPRRRPEPAWAAAAPAQQVTRARLAPLCPRPPAPPTYDFRAAVTAGVLEARLALLVGPVPEARVLNLQGRDGPKSEAKSAMPPAPRGTDKGNQSLRADGCPGETAPPQARRRGVPGSRAAQTFLRPGPLGARRGLPAARLPHLTFAAQLPEELLVLELASLVGHDARHLPALRLRRPAGLRASAGTRWPALR